MSTSPAVATDPIEPCHPWVAGIAAATAALDQVTQAGLDPVSLSTSEKKALLVDLTGLITRATALRSQVLADADDVAQATADRSAATWLATEVHTDPRDLERDQRLGTLLTRWPGVAHAATTGTLTWDQTAVIAHALDRLPHHQLDPDLVAQAEAHLIAQATQFDPRALRRLGAKLLHVIAPDLAEDHDHALLLAEEQRQRAQTRLSFRPRGDGTTDLHARLPDPIAHRLRTYLDAYTSPRRHQPQQPTTQPPPTRPRQ